MPIRPHRREDAPRVGDILAAGWAQAYGAFMPAAFFAPRIDPAYRRAEIAGWFDSFDPATEGVVLVAELDGEVAGFIHVEPGDKGDLGATGVVNLLYVDPARQGRGIGRQLMAAGARWHLEQQAGPLVLSAYRHNPFRHAYAAMGGVEAGTMTHRIADTEVASVLYLWAHPERLAATGTRF
jgi:GNAT superfamily N-acetyltransferase